MTASCATANTSRNSDRIEPAVQRCFEHVGYVRRWGAAPPRTDAQRPRGASVLADSQRSSAKVARRRCSSAFVGLGGKDGVCEDFNFRSRDFVEVEGLAELLNERARDVFDLLVPSQEAPVFRLINDGSKGRRQGFASLRRQTVDAGVFVFKKKAKLHAGRRVDRERDDIHEFLERNKVCRICVPRVVRALPTPTSLSVFVPFWLSLIRFAITIAASCAAANWTKFGRAAGSRPSA